MYFQQVQINFSKYHALGNDFLVLTQDKVRLGPSRLSSLAVSICDRRQGVGADGILYLSKSKSVDARIDIYNADGSWAEKSGNGLRIAALHLSLSSKKKTKRFEFLTGSGRNIVTLKRKSPGGYIVSTSLGQPDFRVKSLPVKSRIKSMINSPLSIGGVKIPVTCLSVGNPHTVMVVDNFDFDWKKLGSTIEHARQFPKGTNVEFVKPINRKRLRLVEWERGAGATGSSGTGAAAAVCAMVVQGIANRECSVEFDMGTLDISWDGTTNEISLTGPVSFVMEGSYSF